MAETIAWRVKDSWIDPKRRQGQHFPLISPNFFPSKKKHQRCVIGLSDKKWLNLIVWSDSIKTHTHQEEILLFCHFCHYSFPGYSAYILLTLSHCRTHLLINDYMVILIIRMLALIEDLIIVKSLPDRYSIHINVLIALHHRGSHQHTQLIENTFVTITVLYVRQPWNCIMAFGFLCLKIPTSFTALFYTLYYFINNKVPNLSTLNCVYSHSSGMIK